MPADTLHGLPPHMTAGILAGWPQKGLKNTCSRVSSPTPSQADMKKEVLLCESIACFILLSAIDHSHRGSSIHAICAVKGDDEGLLLCRTRSTSSGR